MGDRFDGTFGWPVVFKSGTSWKMSFDFIQCNDTTSVCCKQFIANSLNFAAELQVGQIPAIDRVALQFQVVSFTLKVKQGHIFDRLLKRVRHHGLFVNPKNVENNHNIVTSGSGMLVLPEEPAAVASVALLQDQLLVTEIQETIELFGIRHSNHEILGCEGFLAEQKVSMLDVDFIEQFCFSIRDVVTPDTMARVHFGGENAQELVQQLALHHPH